MPVTDARSVFTLLICPEKKLNSELMPMVAKSLPLAPLRNIPGYPDRSQLAGILRSFEARLCFLEFHADDSHGFEILEHLRSLAPGVPVIAVLPSDNPNLVLRCLRQGAVDFLTYPFTPDQLESALAKAEKLVRQTRSQSRVPGKTIAVVPGKAGSGATTLACSLAWHCRRQGAARTLLADLDPLTGTASFLLKVKSAYSFMDVLQRAASLDIDLWKQMIAPVHGIDVLLAPEAPVDASTELPSVMPVMEFARPAYDALVLDCSSAATMWNLSIAKACDELVLVTSADLPALYATQRTLAWYRKSEVESRIKLVVGRPASRTGISTENISSVLGLDVYATLPSNPGAVAKSMMVGKPISRGTDLGQAIAELARKLMPAASKENNEPAGRFRGLLSSMFSRS